MGFKFPKGGQEKNGMENAVDGKRVFPLSKL